VNPSEQAEYQLPFSGITPLSRACSAAAADRAVSKVEQDRVAILAFVLDRGAHGATDREIQDALQMDPSSERPRRIELVRAGRVTDGYTTRISPSGRACTVWVAVKEEA
jgi:hypothetical protein